MAFSTVQLTYVLLSLITIAYGQRCWVPLEPPLPGVLPGILKPKIILAQDIDYPPYAYLSDSPQDDYGLTGFGHDVAKAMGKQCNLDVFTVQTDWDQCWNGGKIGAGLVNGHYHGCMTYTHTIGERNRYMEFSDPILQDNKPAGILTRLKDGKPVISPMSDLKGVKIVDVKGWAPTSDGLVFVKNSCTGKNFVEYELVIPEESGNDAAIKLLLNGSADAMFVYADQAYNFQCNDPSITPSWDCDLWKGFGTKYAYIHTGMLGYAIAGTTLSMSKKGSGLPDIINPCLEKVLQSKKYFYLCRKYDLSSSCFPNKFFPNSTGSTDPWDLPTKDQTKTCADGYCTCQGV